MWFRDSLFRVPAPPPEAFRGLCPGAWNGGPSFLHGGDSADLRRQLLVLLVAFWACAQSLSVLFSFSSSFPRHSGQLNSVQVLRAQCVTVVGCLACGCWWLLAGSWRIWTSDSGLTVSQIGLLADPFHPVSFHSLFFSKACNPASEDLRHHSAHNTLYVDGRQNRQGEGSSILPRHHTAFLTSREEFRTLVGSVILISCFLLFSSPFLP